VTSGHGPVDRRVDGLAVYDAPGPPGAPRVVLVHGSMDRAASFVRTVRQLRELDVVRYDRRGYGRSAAAGVADSVAAHVDDLLAVVGTEGAVVVGHSLGGVIAVAAAVRRPDLIPSVGAFESPMSWLTTWPKRSAGGQALASGEDEAAERFMRGILGDAGWERLPAGTRAARRAEGPALVAELASLRREAPYDPTAITVPVLTGYGSESKPYHQDAARQLAEEAALGELVVIEGSGHAAPVTHATEFAAFVRRAVARA
jgi:pimeloyl-ACP methyl ester carboxylesterase